jgi:hypothetical protein
VKELLESPPQLLAGRGSAPPPETRSASNDQSSLIRKVRLAVSLFFFDVVLTVLCSSTNLSHLIIPHNNTRLPYTGLVNEKPCDGRPSLPTNLST